MSLHNEDQVKQALGIDDWRRLSKEKVVQFAAMVPDLDREVLLRIVEHLPEFRKFGEVALQQLDATQQTLFESNDKSLVGLQRTFEETQKMLAEMLARPNLSPEERLYFTEKTFELLRMAADVHKENQNFLHRQGVVKALVAVGTVAVSVLAIGGRLVLNRLR